MVGTGFMGRAHSNAWLGVNRFFDLPRQAVLHTVVGRDLTAAEAFARRWGWRRAVKSLDEALAGGEVALVDLCTPNHVHAPHAIAALQAGRHVACEKPLAGTLADATRMRDAARRAAKSGARTWVWFNYRRAPAVAYARRLVADGALGRLYHVRAAYLQEWGAPATPMSWRYDAAQAGSGAHGDLNAHIVDMARFVTGLEIEEIAGALEARFVDDRPGPGRGSGAPRAPSTVDDCVLFLARLSSGAVGSFEASRLATGNLNRNCMEINGERGAVRFDFERMNELQWFDATADPGRRGWARVMCTAASAHPWIGAYWPPGHPIGYAEGFTNQAADMILEAAGATPAAPLPDFEDAWKTQRVLDAALVAARERRAVRVADVAG
jgi:predicted dehydrogenase